MYGSYMPSPPLGSISPWCRVGLYTELHDSSLHIVSANSESLRENLILTASIDGQSQLPYLI